MRALRIIGSWWMLAALAIAHAALYVRVGVYEEAPYAKFLHLLWHTPPGMVLYGAMVCSLAAASILVIIRRLWPRSISPDDVRAMDSYIELRTEAGIDPEKWILERGFVPRKVQGGLIARKGISAVIVGTVARVGVLALLVTLPLSERMRESGEVVLSEGESGMLLGQEVRLQSLSHGLGRQFFQIGDSATFTIEKASARLKAGDGEFEITGSGPASYAGAGYRITHLGYSVAIANVSGGKALALDLLPPGRTHRIRQAGMSIRIEPEELVKKGLLTGKRYSLDNPLFAITIEGQDRKILLRARERDANTGLGLGELGYYARITAVRDPVLGLVKAGLATTLISGILMLVRFFWYERRFACAMDGDRMVLGYSEEFLKKWGVYKFRRWTEGLE